MVDSFNTISPSDVDMTLSGLLAWQASRHHGNGKPKISAMVRIRTETKAQSIRV